MHNLENLAPYERTIVELSDAVAAYRQAHSNRDENSMTLAIGPALAELQNALSDEEHGGRRAGVAALQIAVLARMALRRSITQPRSLLPFFDNFGPNGCGSGPLLPLVIRFISAIER